MTRTALLLLPLLAALLGCGAPGYEIVNLIGQVTIDGTPVAAGTISFIPVEGNRGQGVTVPIVAGRYEATGVPRGKLRVDFNATRETGKMVDFFGKPTPEIVSIVPERYRAGLEIEVAGDNSQQDFALTTK